jgi:hypothetical protein
MLLRWTALASYASGVAEAFRDVARASRAVPIAITQGIFVMIRGAFCHHRGNFAASLGMGTQAARLLSSSRAFDSEGVSREVEAKIERRNAAVYAKAVCLLRDLPDDPQGTRWHR